MSVYFKDAELACPCCGKCEMDDYFMALLVEAREAAGIPFKVNSAYRCDKHNLDVGGKPGSAHRHGKAADIEATNSRQRFIIVKSLIYAGFSRLGIGKTFVHVDRDETKDEDVCWLY